MDVKVGSGAFMPTYALSQDLAQAIVGVANGAGCKTTALLTDMNRVLASSAGNAVEVREAVRFLTGEYRNPRLLEVTLALCVEMLLSGGPAQARGRRAPNCRRCWTTARRRRCLAAWWRRQGAIDFVERYDSYLPAATLSKPVYAEKPASSAPWIPARWVVSLGGGRRRASDAIDYSVGLTEVARRAIKWMPSSRWR